MGIKKQNSKASGNESGAFEIAEVTVLADSKTKRGRSKNNEENLYDTASPAAAAFSDKELLRVLTAVRNGDFSVRMPIDEVGMTGKICDTLNDIISLNEKMMEEFTKAGSTIGKQGKLTRRIELPSAKGSWSTGVESLNSL